MDLPEPLSSWCETHLGRYTVAADCSHAHGESRVWRLESRGVPYFLKAHRQAGKWARELYAYENWTPVISDFTSRVVAYREEEPRAILFAGLPGVAMESLSLDAKQEAACWTVAGSTLRRLHTLSNPWFGRPYRDGSHDKDARPDAVAFWEVRFAEWIDRAETGGHLNVDAIAFARAALADVAVLEGESAVATQQDYTPRNWIVSPEMGEWLGAIDFEHACWDIRAADFKRYYDREFIGRADIEEAFWSGYGLVPDDRLQAQILFVRLQSAVSTVVWATEHNDPNFCEHGRAALARMMATRK